MDVQGVVARSGSACAWMIADRGVFGTLLPEGRRVAR
jgi:hypothetical protein